MAIIIGDTPLYGTVTLSNGLTYQKTFKDGQETYVAVAQPYTLPDADDYVLRAGDNMTGSLKSPRFVGNYALEDLREAS